MTAPTNKMMTVSEYVIHHGVTAMIGAKRQAVVAYDFAARIERQRNWARRELKKARNALPYQGARGPSW